MRIQLKVTVLRGDVFCEGPVSQLSGCVDVAGYSAELEPEAGSALTLALTFIFKIFSFLFISEWK